MTVRGHAEVADRSDWRPQNPAGRHAKPSPRKVEARIELKQWLNQWSA